MRPSKVFGTVLPRPEIHHVDRPHRSNIGDFRADDGTEAILRARQNTAEQMIGHFRRGDIDDAFQQPESTSFSMDCPPVPVAWNTKHSKSFSIRARICVMQGVVTPNMVRPTPGLSDFSRFTEFSAMPAAAWAALAITLREMR